MKAIRPAFYILLALLLLTRMQGVSYAHPHVFFDVYTEVQYDAEGIMGFDLVMELDSFSSELYLAEDVEMKNRTFTDDELKQMTTDLDFIRKHLSLKLGGKLLTEYTTSITSAELYKKKIILHYFIKVSIPFTDKPQSLEMSLDDLTIYVSYTFSTAITLKSLDGKPASKLSFENQLITLIVAIEPKPAPLPVSSAEPSPHPVAPVKVTAKESAVGTASLWAKLRATQAKFNRKLSEMVFKAKENLTASLLGMIFLFSFLYGMLHAIGPGHGKTIVTGFFIEQQASVIKAPILALIISVVHTGAALLLSGIFIAVLSNVKGLETMRIQTRLTFVIALLILLYGIILLVSKIRRGVAGVERKPGSLKKGMVRIGILAGSLPCPLSITIMLVSFSAHIMIVGFVSVIGIALGMIVVLSVVGIITIKAKDGVNRLSKGTAEKPGKFLTAIEYIGPCFVILAGLGMALLYMPQF